MKKLNIKTKEIQLLVLFGVFTLLFISLNFANTYSPKGNDIFDDELPRSAAISINIVSPTFNDNFSVAAPDFIVEISDAVNPINTTWYTIDGGATNITFINNGTIDQNNWTALVDGPVTITFYANNSISEIDFASRDINKDTGAPVVTVTSPIGSDYYSTTAPDYIVEISDSGSAIDTMWYTIDGGVTNITFIVNGTIDLPNWTALADGPLTMVFYANDSAGNLDSDPVSINKDSLDPTVSITSQTGGEYYNATAPGFTVEILDNNLDNMWYTIDAGVTNITFIVNGTIDQNNWTALADGPVTMVFYANDSAGNFNFDLVLVNKDTGNPIVDISSHLGGEFIGALAPDYIVEISDSDSIIDTMWYTIDGGAINITFTVNGTIDQNNWTARAEGPVTIVFYTNDTVGNIGFDSVVVNKDSLDPTVSITSPAGGEYFNATAPDYVVVISDSGSPIDTMWYTIDGGATNITFTNNGTINLSNWTALADGPVTIFFYANDSAGNINSDSVLVNKDTGLPTVVITSPTTDQDFGVIAPDFIVEISDSLNPIDSMWYTIDGGITNITFTINETIDQNSWTARPDGSVTLTFYANDTLGNIGFNSVDVNKDTGVPVVTVTSPTTDQDFGVAAPDFIVEISDSLNPIDSMWYTIDGGITNITFTTNETIDQNSWTARPDGSVTLTFYANDTVGNIGFNSVDVNKDTGAPVVTVTSPTGGEDFGVIAPDFIVEISDSLNPIDTMWYTIDGGITNITFTINETIDQNSWTATPDGSVTLTFYANDTLGNIGFNSVDVNKDTVAPTINLVSPTLLQLLGVNSPSFIVEIDDPILDTMWYTVNNGLTNITFGTNGTFNPLAWSSVPNGTWTIYFYANDSVGNEASDSVVVEVDKFIPTITVNLPIDETVIATLPIINITVNDTNVDSIWYRVGTTIITLANNTDQSLNLLIWNALSEGAFTIELFANDTAGNLNNFYTINLIKDISAPIVDIVHPLSNATDSTSAPQITLIIDDATLDTTWYTIVGIDDIFEFNATIGTNVITIDQTAWNSLSEGVVTIIFHANDSLGRISSDSITFNKVVPEVFDFIAFLLSPPVLTIIGVAIAIIVVTVFLVKRRGSHKTSDKEVRRIDSLWD